MTMPVPAIAAIVHADRRAADKLLDDFAARLMRAGHKVHGLVQRRLGGEKTTTVLADLQTGRQYALFQMLGGGSQSCSVDAGELAAASQVLRRALDERADLAIANRFGALEAEGGGLAAEMLALMAEGIPFITVVADEHLPAWRRFTGDAAIDLPADRAVLDKWFTAVSPS